MPSKKKKYNARFPAGRIKKIMQSDEEVGKVAQAVPVIISRTLELFVSSLLQKAMQITSAKNAKTLTTTHMKQCILSEQRFDFLKDLVKSVQDSANGEDDIIGTAPNPLVSVPNRTFPQRRKSSCSSAKEELSMKEEIKEEPTDERSQVSTIQMNPNYYAESMARPSAPETITEPQANCSTHHFNPNFYSESVSGARQYSSVIKMEPHQVTTSQSTIPFNPNYYSQSVVSPHLIKRDKITESPVSSTICFSPNFYSESVAEQRNTETSKESPLVMANCSKLHFGPNFYSETVSEQRNIETSSEHPQVIANCSSLRYGPSFYSENQPEQPESIHRPPMDLPHQEPTRIAHLSMDEDYDT